MQSSRSRSQAERFAGDGGISMGGKGKSWSVETDQDSKKSTLKNVNLLRASVNSSISNDSGTPVLATNKINILYTNADCLTNKKAELQLYIDNSNPKPDIIIITEVNSKVQCTGMQESEFALNGYNIFGCNVGYANRRGIIVYIHKSLVGVQVEIPINFSEFVLVNINNKNGCCLTIAAIYRSPSSNRSNDTALFNLIKFLSKTTKNKLLLVGDFNFCNIDWDICTSSNSHINEFLTCLKDNFLIQHVLCPTRIRGLQKPNILDLVISNDDFVGDIEYLSPLGKSDHAVLLFSVSVDVIFCSDNIRFNYSKGDYLNLNNHLQSLFALADFDCIIDVNLFWSAFKNCICEAVSKFVPRSNDTILKNKSWKYTIPQNCRNFIKQKHRLWKQYRESRSKDKLCEYKRVRNLVRKETRKIVQKNQAEVAKSCKANPKKFWMYVNSKTKTHSSISDLHIKRDNGSFEIITSDLQKANAFADYFETIYNKNSDVSQEFYNIAPIITNQFEELNITEAVVYNKLKDVKVNKSPGPDSIHPRILFETRDIICPILTKLFNLSFRNSQLPDEWITSVVSVLFKKGSKKQVENYRPISLTCIVCKILESIIKDHIMTYFIRNNLFSVNQFGFLKGRSCVLQLLNILSDWNNIIDDGGQIDVIYTDFEKAFDKVSHYYLLKKLKCYGVGNLIINWIQAFLTKRKQSVRLNGTFSSSRNVISGIPQGTVLGPLLFIIFINDLPDVCIDLAKLFMFADDAKLYKAISCQSDSEVLNFCCQQLFAWSENNGMTLNAEKCKVLHIHKHNMPLVNSDYSFDAKNGTKVCLGQLSNIKDLGVVIDNDLSFSIHIHEKKILPI